ncbi:hypothetical protein [Pedobacter sp.]
MKETTRDMMMPIIAEYWKNTKGSMKLADQCFEMYAKCQEICQCEGEE